MPATRLNILLIKADVADPIDDGEGRQRLETTLGAASTLVTAQVRGRQPKWTSLVATLSKTAVPRLENANASAALVLKVGGRRFAVVFGYGRSLLKPGCWEDLFGLKVALNSIEEDTLILSIDKKELDTLTRHTRINASRAGELSAFGFEPDKDMLRAVTGTPSDRDTFGKRISGADALIVSAHIASPVDLRRLMARCLDAFNSTAYQDRFPGIDNIHEVKDKEIVTDLDMEMTKRIRGDNEEGRQWMAPPGPVDWSTVTGFRYSRSERARTVDDLHLDSFGETLRGESTSANTLKQRAVIAVNEDEDEVDAWPAYRCIYCEITRDENLYILTDGKWYAVQRGFVDEISKAARKLVTATSLPPYRHRDEGAYNASVSKSTGHALYDRKLIRYGGSRSKIEFCDLLTAQGCMYHVKRYTGSSTLSHLFAQGVVAASSFAGDPLFVAAVEKLLPRGFSCPWPTGTPDPSKLSLNYAIISKSKDSIDASLPFFSKVALVAAAKQLRGTRISVSVQKIQA